LRSLTRLLVVIGRSGEQKQSSERLDEGQFVMSLRKRLLRLGQVPFAFRIRVSDEAKMKRQRHRTPSVSACRCSFGAIKTRALRGWSSSPHEIGSSLSSCLASVFRSFFPVCPRTVPARCLSSVAPYGSLEPQVTSDSSHSGHKRARKQLSGLSSEDPPGFKRF